MSSSAMANTSQQSYQQNGSPHHCKECGLYLNSAKSLEVHLQYHKENLLKHWAIQAASSAPNEETNNNTTSSQVVNPNPQAKREFLSSTSTIAAAADSSDSMSLKKSPEYQRTSNTPEYIIGHPPTPQSYQSASSPYQNNQDAFSPNFQNYQPVKTERSSPQPNYQNYSYQEQFFLETQQQNYNQTQQDYLSSKQYRYHPYSSSYDRQNHTVSSSSPAYPPQPTPSPSPKQCDKCGYVCESATQLIEHLNIAHPTNFPHQFGFNLENSGSKQQEEDPQSEILDLDSHKVHQVYPPPPEEEKRNEQHPHSVSAMLNSWPTQSYLNPSTPSYRPFEHLPQQPPVISSTQVPTPPQQTPSPASSKSTNWKSNEARRPKTYNCTACNKWFTSSGHLKRHYNTTLHKNAVKSSGQPDPASLPISAHHHPTRESTSSKEDNSGGSPDDSRNEDTNSLPFGERLNPMAGLIQQPPNGPYDRQLQHIPGGSPPNGEAGPSVDPRGLLNHLQQPAIINPSFGAIAPPSTVLEQHQDQFQMYPNGSAPHVMQAMATTTNSHSTTGDQQAEEHFHNGFSLEDQQQPLPSFSQIHHRYGLLLSSHQANVGGGVSATTPFTTFYQTGGEAAPNDDEDYHLTVLTSAEPFQQQQQNNTTEVIPLKLRPASPEKARIKRDYEETTGSPIITSTVALHQNPKSDPATLHKCFDCDKIFNKACYLTQHNKTFHCGDKPFKCTRCGKRFSCEMTFEKHSTKHAGEKPHKCDLCPKQFNHKTDLRRHMCLHTGQKPYACDTCGKGFIRKDHMIKHCETHTRKHLNKSGQIRR